MDRILLKNADVFFCNQITPMDVFIDNGIIADVAPTLLPEGAYIVIDASNKLLIPGFVDVHVHLREPGFSYKETIVTGTLAAAAGGYTAVCAMPNLNPVPDTKATLDFELQRIKEHATVRVCPYGSITIGQKGETLSSMEELASHVVAFSDDGFGVQDADMMRSAMKKAKSLNKIIVAHAEDESELSPEGWAIHDGEYAKLHGHKGNASASEWKQVKRDIALAEETMCRYHVCHVSTKESVALIREAKAKGVQVTCETAPHYLLLTDMDLQDSGNFKMNPPIRSKEDQAALIEGLKDGTIDMIITDHAPHSAEEKAKGLDGSLNGVVGLETAFTTLYTGLVLKNIISLEKLIELMCITPRKIFGLVGGRIEVGQVADVTLLDLDEVYTIQAEKFLSRGKSSPFDGWKTQGRPILTIVGGNIIWQKKGVRVCG